mmetsp:Transcript_2384/g.3649  ORF Transcript_2384/g.3649 Transcript_2384/m.3649 type:complete len:147 (-) Transcript_2384:5070-5510(-)
MTAAAERGEDNEEDEAKKVMKRFERIFGHMISAEHDDIQKATFDSNLDELLLGGNTLESKKEGWSPLRSEERNVLVQKLLNDKENIEVRKFIQDMYLDEVATNVNKFLSMDFEEYKKIANQINSKDSDSDEEFNPKDWAKKLKRQN